MLLQRSGTFCTSIAVLLVAVTLPAELADAVEYPLMAPLFAADSPLDVAIEAPLEALMRDRPDVEYLDGTFSFTEPDGTGRSFDLKLRTRGNYRRDEEHCDFAPIRLNFDKSQVAGTLLSGQDKLKLVTHCRSKSRNFDRYVVREYLAYRLFHALTRVSYDVRLLRISYTDTDTGKSMTRLGFVIEDDEAVAERNDLNVIKIRHVAQKDIDRRRLNLVHVFEYMIGNTEYSLVNPEPDKNCCHNAGVLSASDTPPYAPLPYDFDFSGIVNAPYAQPNPRYPIRYVRKRHYRGLCTNNELLPETLQLFFDARDDFYRIVDEVHSLTGFSARNVRQYLNSFYRKINDPDSVQKSLVNACYEPVS